MPKIQLTAREIQAQDYYQRLGLDREASPTVIKRAFRAQSLIYHPDKNPDLDVAEAGLRFTLIHDAYNVLSDPNEKRIYDHMLENQWGGNFAPKREYQQSQQFKYILPAGARCKDANLSNNYVVAVNQMGGIDLFFNQTGAHIRHFTREIPPDQAARRNLHYYDAIICEEENWILATNMSGDIDCFDIATGQCIKTYKNADKGLAAFHVLISDKDNIFCYRYHNLQKLNATGTFSYFKDVMYTELSADKKYLVTVKLIGYSPSIEILDAKKARAEIIYSAPSHLVQLATIRQAILSPSSQHLAYFGYISLNSMGENPQKLVIQNLYNEDKIEIIEPDLQAICFSPCGQYIALACGESGCKIYSLKTRQLVERIDVEIDNHDYQGHFIEKVFFSNNGRLLLVTTKGIYNAPLPESMQEVILLEKKTEVLLPLTFMEEEDELIPAPAAYNTGSAAMETKDLEATFTTANDYKGRAAVGDCKEPFKPPISTLTTITTAELRTIFDKNKRIGMFSGNFFTIDYRAYGRSPSIQRLYLLLLNKERYALNNVTFGEIQTALSQESLRQARLENSMAWKPYDKNMIPETNTDRIIYQINTLFHRNQESKISHLSLSQLEKIDARIYTLTTEIANHYSLKDKALKKHKIDMLLELKQQAMDKPVTDAIADVLDKYPDGVSGCCSKTKALLDELLAETQSSTMQNQNR